MPPLHRLAQGMKTRGGMRQGDIAARVGVARKKR